MRGKLLAATLLPVLTFVSLSLWTAPIAQATTGVTCAGIGSGNGESAICTATNTTTIPPAYPCSSSCTPPPPLTCQQMIPGGTGDAYLVFSYVPLPIGYDGDSNNYWYYIYIYHITVTIDATTGIHTCSLGQRYWNGYSYVAITIPCGRSCIPGGYPTSSQIGEADDWWLGAISSNPPDNKIIVWNPTTFHTSINNPNGLPLDGVPVLTSDPFDLGNGITLKLTIHAQITYLGTTWNFGDSCSLPNCNYLANPGMNVQHQYTHDTTKCPIPILPTCSPNPISNTGTYTVTARGEVQLAVWATYGNVRTPIIYNKYFTAPATSEVTIVRQVEGI